MNWIQIAFSLKFNCSRACLELEIGHLTETLSDGHLLLTKLLLVCSHLLDQGRKCTRIRGPS